MASSFTFMRLCVPCAVTLVAVAQFTVETTAQERFTTTDLASLALCAEHYEWLEGSAAGRGEFAEARDYKKRRSIMLDRATELGANIDGLLVLKSADHLAKRLEAGIEAAGGEPATGAEAQILDWDRRCNLLVYELDG